MILLKISQKKGKKARKGAGARGTGVFGRHKKSRPG
jgi:hypothetical protein